jgi:hypothetical protein
MGLNTCSNDACGIAEGHQLSLHQCCQWRHAKYRRNPRGLIAARRDAADEPAFSDG